VNDTAKRFWVVWNPSRGLPRHQHGTEAEAATEATRLARLHPGETFIVLCSIEEHRVAPPDPPPVRVRTHKTVTLPF